VLEYRLYGTEGHILFDVMKDDVALYRADGSVDENPVSPTQSSATPYSSSYPEDAPVNNLVDVILGRDDNRSPGVLAARVVALLEAAYASAADGRPHPVPTT
jgi:predicted dehydrogenase